MTRTTKGTSRGMNEHFSRLNILVATDGRLYGRSAVRLLVDDSPQMVVAGSVELPSFPAASSDGPGKLGSNAHRNLCRLASGMEFCPLDLFSTQTHVGRCN